MKNENVFQLHVYENDETKRTNNYQVQITKYIVNIVIYFI